MTSKNSFLVNLKENNKRRIWLWIVSALCWFIYYPVTVMMIISRQKNLNRTYGYAGDVAKERLLLETGKWFGLKEGAFLASVGLLAVICAIQGFSYLYSRKKVDFYHSIPVEKSRRFMVIYWNGVLIFLVPCLLNLLLAMAVAGINGAMDGKNAAMAVTSLLYALLYYLGIYGLALIAVMLTGNIVITVFATVIFLVYEFLARVLMGSYSMNFYRYFCKHSVKREPFFSPVGQLVELMDKGGGTPWTERLPHILMEAAMAVVFAGIAWFCYKKRPAEAAGKAMAFNRTKGVVKVLLVIPFALGVGLFVMDLIGDTPYVMMVFGMTMAVIVGSCAIEVIYEMDIRAAFYKKYQMLISGGCVAAIFLIFCFDLTGFDKWVPAPGKLEEAHVMFTGDMYRSFVDENFEVVDYEKYWLSRPGIQDLDAVCRLSEEKQDDGRLWCTVAYRMKGGRLVWRNFPVSGEEEEILNRIVGSREYKAVTCQLSDDAIYEGMKRQKISEFSFSTGFERENLLLEDFGEFREAYLKDWEKADYSTFRKEQVCGFIVVDMEKRTQNGTMNRRFNYNIYPSYANTIAFLKEKGVYDRCYPNADEIECITVTNNHNEMYEKDRDSGMSDAEIALSRGRGEYSVSKTFYEEEQIREILQAAYPHEFVTYWTPEGTVSDKYSITVYYKGGVIDTAYRRGNNEACLITDRIPGWLEQETAYQ